MTCTSLLVKNQMTDSVTEANRIRRVVEEQNSRKDLVLVEEMWTSGTLSCIRSLQRTCSQTMLS